MTIDFDALNVEALRRVRAGLEDRELFGGFPGKTLFLAITGSHTYGFPSPDSDIDVRGRYALPLRELIGLKKPTETYNRTFISDGVELDIEAHDLGKYLRLLMKNGGNMLEQILSPLMVESFVGFEEFQQLSCNAMTRGVVRHYQGFLSRQIKIVKETPDVQAKSVLYLFRVALTGIHLLRTGEMELNVRVLNEEFQIPYLPELWDSKVTNPEKAHFANLDRERVLADAQQLDDELRASAATSPLPEELPNFDALEEFLCRLRLEETR